MEQTFAENIRAAAEALVCAQPTPRPAVPWLRREHGLTADEACKAIGLARVLRTQSTNQPK